VKGLEVLRLVTPVLLALILFILNGFKDDIKELKSSTKDLSLTTTAYFTNHLSHHASVEKEICERLARVEAKL
jgi:UDP-N-acetylmuramyl pentapeptide phosphotransferase/UDP-N-acetylglucosamine-1-phosphate transferase